MKHTPLQRKTALRKLSAKRRKNWPARAKCWEIVRERANGMCEMRCSPYCERVGSHPHEILPKGRGGDDTDPENCLWACWPCNIWSHDNDEKATKLGLLKHSWEAKQ